MPVRAEAGGQLAGRGHVAARPLRPPARAGDQKRRGRLRACGQSRGGVSTIPTAPGPPPPPPSPPHSHWILKSGGSRRMLDMAMCPVSPSSNSTITASGSSSSSSLEEPAARAGRGAGAGPGARRPPAATAPPAAPHLAPRSPGRGTATSGSSRRRRGCRAAGCASTAAARPAPAEKRHAGPRPCPRPHLCPHARPHPCPYPHPHPFPYSCPHPHPFNFSLHLRTSAVGQDEL